MTRQRQWQKQQLLAGLCSKCSKPAVTATHCEDHRMSHNKWNVAWRKRRAAAAIAPVRA